MTAVRATPRSNPGMLPPGSVGSGGGGRGLGRFERGEDGLDLDAPARDELAARAAQRAGGGRGPAVLPHEDRRQRTGRERLGRLVEVRLGEQARGRTLEDVEVVV